MTPVQRRRMVWVLLLLLASGLATTLVAFALQRNIA
ncbi:MAG: cytochrome c biogenesis protein CcmE, partial [Stenotrophomonas sp.]